MDAIVALKNRRVLALITTLATLLLASVAIFMVNLALASTFTVNSTADRVDSDVGNGVCKTSAGTCTLRAAIQETNALSGPDTIQVPAATYALAIRPGGGNGANTGDYDITGPLMILGAGADSTILDAGQPRAGSPPEIRGLDRLLEVRATARNVSVSGLTIREGYSAETGGGIHNTSAGTLRLENVNVLESYAA
jgi:large repetitive protein